jgi:hypothetical protein
MLEPRRRQEAISPLGVRIKEPAATVAVRGEHEPRTVQGPFEIAMI